jgi:hypothetical protein
LASLLGWQLIKRTKRSIIMPTLGSEIVDGVVGADNPLSRPYRLGALPTVDTYLLPRSFRPQSTIIPT